MRLGLAGGALCVIGGVAVLAGVLPPSELATIAERVWPVLLFVVAATIVAELAAAAGLFDLVAERLARAARGRTWLLWLLVLGLATVTTAFLSLDTTAVLLTPVVVTMARQHRLDPLPFAFVTVVLANTASLVLPVSNLTNLLAAERAGVTDPWRFLTLLGPSAAIAIVVSAVVLTVVFLPRLPRRHEPAAPPEVSDPVLLRVAGVVVAVLLPLLVIGIAPWIPALAAAAVLGAAFLWRAPRAIRPTVVPWSLLLFAGGLFVVVGAAEQLGLGVLTAALVGHESVWQVAGAGLVAANAVNNLPAFLALESAAGGGERLAALLVGVNAGPLLTPWASLATLLWFGRLKAMGVEVRWTRFVVLGLVVAPLTVAAAVLPLAL
ncbi:SLC13 family permease [Microbacterium lushaniae]|uniref:SLC13 family permease n=1 Tax=Microbacterium lushaniae TaxID=2614639 RepID=UPI001EE830BE|nr:SLC13 family permease [Microbacterium lushaniae]